MRHLLLICSLCLVFSSGCRLSGNKSSPASGSIQSLNQARFEPEPPQINAQFDVRVLDGTAAIFHPINKEFLGNISSNAYDSNSICNQYGTYGSRYSSFSVFAEHGTYGSPYSTYSAYNPRSDRPPIIVDVDGKPLALLTKNTNFNNAIDPDMLHYAICGQK